MLPAQGYFVNQCMMYEEKDEPNKWKCQANIISMEDEKNCQSILCSDKTCQSILCDKNCQSSKCLHMWSVKPAMKQSAYKKFNRESVFDDKTVNLPSLSTCGQGSQQ